VSRLILCGGKDAKSAVRAMVQELLTHNMQCEVNCSGVGLQEKAKASSHREFEEKVPGFTEVFFDVVRSEC
jgi:hypothetical protein